ncbi:MAG TPA: hypothetical protein VGX25_05640 [Actinophytocola sp.]|nr:hypothetical protein [Actinophytocola sp.]HEV2778866.1 hypothetical protein [Actinophytocola sp.]
MLPRLDEIEDDLLAWLGEVEGIDLTLTSCRDLSSMSGILADSSYRLLPA